MAVDNPARILALSAQAAAATEDDMVTQTDCGAIPKNTFIPAGTLYSDLIPQLLGATPATVNIYIGATTNIPTSINDPGLSLKSVSNTSLLHNEGYIATIKAGDPTVIPAVAQYPVIAVPRTPNEYTLTSWQITALAYDLPFTRVVDSANNYNIYYLNTPSYDEDIGGCNYKFKFICS